MKVSQNSNLSFTSKIKFVTNDEFKSKTGNEVRDWSNDTYIGSPWDSSTVGSKGLTEDIHACNAGGVVDLNSKKMLLFHFKPWSVLRFDQIKDELAQKLNNMSESKEKLAGLLIGGKTHESMDWNYQKSQDLSKKFSDMFKDWKVNFSKFLGQPEYGGYSNVFYSADEDSWYVNYQNENKDTYGKKFNIKNSNEIKQVYKDIQISDNDQVYIGDQEVDKLALDPSFSEIQGGFKFDFAEKIECYLPKKESVNLYLGNFGQDNSALWVESDNEEAINAVVNNINKIKQSNKFGEVKKIQYSGDNQISGFEKLNQKDLNGKQIFEKQV